MHRLLLGNIEAGNTLINGHNRYDICTRNNIAYETRLIKFDSREDAKVWIIDNQFGRRNISDFVRGELVLQKKDIIAKLAKANQGNRADLSQNSVESKPIDTQKELAKQAGVSHDTIYKIEKIKATADESLLVHILAHSDH